MWFVTTVYFNRFGFKGDPEGMFGALLGLFFVGPLTSGLYILGVVALYRSEEDQQKASRVLGIAVIIPIALFALAFLIIE